MPQSNPIRATGLGVVVVFSSKVLLSNALQFGSMVHCTKLGQVRYVTHGPLVWQEPTRLDRPLGCFAISVALEVWQGEPAHNHLCHGRS